VVVALTLGIPAHFSTAQPEHGGQAPGFSLPALDGATVSLADLRGKIVVLHFGAGW